MTTPAESTDTAPTCSGCRASLRGNVRGLMTCDTAECPGNLRMDEPPSTGTATRLAVLLRGAPDPGGWRAGMDDDDYAELAAALVEAGVGFVAQAKAEAWDERSEARPQYLGPDDGHYAECMGWEDCRCASYPNPYRAAREGGAE